MISKIIFFMGVAGVMAAPPPPSYHAPVHHAPSYGHPDPVVPPKYEYSYAVADDYSKVDFDQTESRDGYSTSGKYRVALPDGRTQLVSYQVLDDQSGYVADVQYQGEAQYPPAHPSYKPVPLQSYPRPH